MQAITTKFICPTNFKGSRISAQADAGRIILSCDDALNMEENHILAATTLANKYGWLDRHSLASGTNHHGDWVHVLVDKR